MRKNVLTTTFAAIACAAVVAAQAPQTPQVPAPPSQPAAPAQRAPEAKSTAANFTVIGCVERRAEASSATPGAIGTSGAVGAPGFILTKVMGPTAKASPGSTATAATYQLDADDSKLTGHVGQKVEITGALADRSASVSKSSGDAPRLKVESLKMIAATCTD